MALPQIIVTGSSGFVGRHLLERLAGQYRIFGVARRSQVRSHAPAHPDIAWFEADVGDRPQLEATFARIAELGGAQTVVHLAAHYDFTGDESPEYWRTNVEGLRNVLDLSVELGVRHFVFSSSVAACELPPPGAALTEDSPPDGRHIYARTKGAGERMLAEYADRLSPVIVRFAALFSDWCEYPPLYMFLQTWLSWAWNARLLGGRGRSAIPYLHVQDVVLFLEQVLDRLDDLRPGEVLVASPDGCTSHEELFGAATLAYRGARTTPLHMPKLLCGPGMAARDLLGRLTGTRPFERPWMAQYIDTEMRIDASRSRARLDWAPRDRLAILRRMPFLIENLRTDPLEWNRRNREALKQVHVPDHLRVHWLLRKHEDVIIREFHGLLTGPLGPTRFPSYQSLTPEQHEWHHRLLMRHVLNAVRTRDRGVFMGYCRDLAERRLSEGFEANELCGALEGFNLACLRVLRRDQSLQDLRQAVTDHLTATLRAGCDQAQEVFELHAARKLRHH